MDLFKKINYRGIKCLFICIFIFITFFCFLSPCHSLASTDVIDVETAFLYEQELWNINVINLMIAHLENNYSDASIIRDFMADMSTGNRFFWIERYSGGRYVIFVYTFRDVNPDTTATKSLWNSSAQYNLPAFSIKPDYWIDTGNSTFTKNTNDPYTYTCVKPCYGFRSDTLNTFLQKYYYHANDIDIVDVYNEMSSKLRKILDAINNIDNTELNVNFNELILALNKNQQETSQKLDGLKKSIDETNKFLKDTNTDDSDYGFSSDNGTNDVTSDGLNSIFTTFYNCFANAEEKDIVFPLPFVNKSITIPAKFLENTLKAHGFQFVVDLARTVWLFAISCFIIKDISNYVEKLKTGEILSKSDTNIKTDIL